MVRKTHPTLLNSSFRQTKFRNDVENPKPMTLIKSNVIDYQYGVPGKGNLPYLLLHNLQKIVLNV